MIPHLVPVAEPKSAREAMELARRIAAQRQLWQVKSAKEARRAHLMRTIDKRARRTSKIEIILLRNICRARRVARKWHYTPPDPHRIIKWCAGRYGVTVDSVKSPSRKQKVVRARHLAMMLIKHSKNGRNLSLKQIGRLFGDLDHTTVLNCLSRSPAARKYIGKANSWKFDVDDVAAVFRRRMAFESWEKSAEAGMFCAPFYTRLLCTMKEAGQSERASLVASKLGMGEQEMISALVAATEVVKQRLRHLKK